MKNFKQIREKTNFATLDEKNRLSYSVKDAKTAEFIRKELSSLVKADFNIKKKGVNHVIDMSPKTSQDEKVIKSFMDDAKIEMIKDELVKELTRSKMTNEDACLKNFEEETVVIKPHQAEQIIEIHDTLNKDNQELFMEMLVHSKETFEQMISFCETYSKKGK